MASVRSLLTAATVLGAALVPGPSQANTEWAGFTCQFTSSNEPTGVVNQDPNVQTGEIDCGPWTAFDITNDDLTGPAASPSAGHIEICGWIQVNNAVYGVPTTASVCGSGEGIAAAFGAITYTANATDNVFMCTQVTMTDDTTEVYQYDADGEAGNGNQCGQAAHASIAVPLGQASNCTYVWSDRGVYFSFC